MSKSRLFGAGAALVAALLAGYGAAALTAPAESPAAQSPPAEAGVLSPATEELSWPRTIKEGAETITVYQPQVEKWEGQQISCRAAVSVQGAEDVEPTFGVVWLTASADVDKAARVVTLQNFQITKVAFPTAPEKDAPYADVFRKLLPEGVKTIALDHLEASLAVSQAVQKQEQLQVKNEPPKIIYATTPTVLALVDGPPVLRAMPGLDAERVLNTRALIARVAGNYYVTVLGFWYEAASLDGPWVPIDNPPAILEKIKSAAVALNMVDLMAPSPTATPPAAPPNVVVSSVPTELIQTDGLAKVLPIEGTQLLQVQNSDDAIFMDINTNLYYVLISGRWFRAKALNGPWEFVSAKSLPADFAKIPPDHPRGNALVSVAGTPQAQEALIANSIPQTATVNRSAAQLTVTYDGPPQFAPIQGTALQYAVNATLPVIEAGPHSFYCVQNGVWFTAPDPMGPWSVATSVPPAIYSIPASSPVHNVTYAYVYGSTPDEVYDGYTPGYLGTCVSPDNVVVYGTGYNYPPYCGSEWIGYPCTYGFQAGFCCNDYMGYGFGFGLGFVPGCSPQPWWGPFGWARNHGINYNHISLNHVNMYRHWNSGVVSIHHHFAGNQWEGQRGWSNAREPFSPYSARQRTGGAAGGWDANARARAFPSITLPRMTGVGAGSRANTNSVFAGPRGEVYRRTTAGGWQQNTRTGWQSAGQSRSFRNVAPMLNRENSARQVGSARVNNFRASGGFTPARSFAPSGGSRPAGGFNPGGGGRGR